MRCVKLPAEPITARDFDSQDAGVQIPVAPMNRFKAPGTGPSAGAAHT